MKKKYCDCCGEEWEETFFCKKCSNKYVGTETVESPRLDWCGWPPQDEMEWVEEDVFSGDVCMNCCTCHMR
jgi:hypothetical protein